MLKKTILLVASDQQRLHVYLKRLNELKELVIVQAIDGTEAYRKGRNQKFDCIVTDYKMPKLAGIQLIRALRVNTLNSETPMLLTLEAEEKDQAVLDDLKTEKLYYNLKIYKRPLVDNFFDDLQKTLIHGAAKTAPTFTFDAGFLNSFISALDATLKDFARIENLTAEKPQVMKDNNTILVDISGSLPIVSSHFTGVISIGFPKLTFLSLAEEVLGEKQESINQDNRDLVGEIVNIVYGKAKRSWSDLGLSFQKTIPSVFDGNTHQLRPMVESSTIILPYQSSFGIFTAIISIKKMKTNAE